MCEFWWGLAEEAAQAWSNEHQRQDQDEDRPYDFLVTRAEDAADAWRRAALMVAFSPLDHGLAAARARSWDEWVNNACRSLIIARIREVPHA